LSIVPSSDGNSLIINCKTIEDAIFIRDLINNSDIGCPAVWKEGKKTVRMNLGDGATLTKKSAKKTVAKKVAKKVATKKVKKIARKVSVKKSGYTGDNVSAQLRMIADQIEKQKSSDPEALFTKLVGDGELMVRTNDRKGNEVLKKISKESFLACFK
jgi:uncharacterized FlaG/YvyC family protein